MELVRQETESLLDENIMPLVVIVEASHACRTYMPISVTDILQTHFTSFDVLASIRL